MATTLLQWGRKGRARDYLNRVEDYPQFYAIAITSGSLRLALPGGSPRDLGPGSAVILTPGISLTLSTPSCAYAGHFVEWPPGDCRLATGPVILRMGRAVLAVLTEIESEYAEDDAGETLPLLYELFARRLLREAGRRGVAPPDRAEALRARLRAHLHTPASVEAILGDASAVRQARRVLAAAGLPAPKRLLLDLRLDEARRLLRETRMPVTAIAMELGFASSQHFATAYRARFATTPGGERAGAGAARATASADVLPSGPAPGRHAPRRRPSRPQGRRRG